LSVGDGAAAGIQAAAYANALYALAEDSAEVLIVAVSGHGRVSDTTRDYPVSGSATFCHRLGGCACPNQESAQPSILPLPGPAILIALSGATSGANGAVEGLSLQAYCARGPLAGTWTGAWWNNNGLALGEGTLTLAQQGSKVTGTATVSGKTCVRRGTITGSVSGSTVQLVLHAERIVTMQGRLDGRVMSGDFSALSCGPPYGPANVTVEVTGTWRATKLR
ncbi:MAG TPA: hypothetical protein VF163_09365, partial [Micromonosporaceae bacterium]